MTKKGFNCSGFTLIELIIVFSVLAILSAISVASFVTYSRVQAINNDTKNIINIINLAKSNANSQVKPAACSSNRVLQGYNVTFITSTFITSGIINRNKYTLNVVCSGGSPISSIQTYPLGKDITFDTITTNASIKIISFPVITGGIKMTNFSNSPISSGTISLTGFGTTCSSNPFYKSLININQDGTITTASGC